MSERFEIRYGKFGAYFYDAISQRDVTLEEAKRMMNLYEASRSKSGEIKEITIKGDTVKVKWDGKQWILTEIIGSVKQRENVVLNPPDGGQRFG
jgi:hypothetical protein